LGGSVWHGLEQPSFRDPDQEGSRVWVSSATVADSSSDMPASAMWAYLLTSAERENSAARSHKKAARAVARGSRGSLDASVTTCRLRRLAALGDTRGAEAAIRSHGLHRRRQPQFVRPRHTDRSVTVAPLIVCLFRSPTPCTAKRRRPPASNASERIPSGPTTNPRPTLNFARVRWGRSRPGLDVRGLDRASCRGLGAKSRAAPSRRSTALSSW